MADKEETFWDRLQEAYDQAKAPTIARKLGVEKQTVYKWRDGTMPGLETLVTISRSTGRSLHWLVTGEGPRQIEASPPLYKPTQPESGVAGDDDFRRQVRPIVIELLKEVFATLQLSTKDRAFADSLLERLKTVEESKPIT